MIAYQAFLKTLKNKNIKLNFIEQSVVWSLIQMNARPDSSSPSSRLQLIVKVHKTHDFWDFSKSPSMKSIRNSIKGYSSEVTTDSPLEQEEPTYPMLYGLEHLLKHYRSKHNLVSLARLLDRYLKSPILVEEYLHRFLKEQKGGVLSHNMLKKSYSKGDEVLKIGETLPKLRFESITQNYLYSKNKIENQSSKYPVNINRYLFPFQAPYIDSESNISCNFDLGLYENSIYLINKSFMQTNIYGVENKSEQFFMANTSQSVSALSPALEAPIFIGNGEERGSAICLLERESISNNKVRRNTTLSFFSTDSRDPGQHLYHLLRGGLNDLESSSQVDTRLRQSRHLFLQNPIRLIYESSRGNDKQLTNLLKLNIPIYHTRALGNIWSHFYRPYKDSSFIVDDRNKNKLSCKF